jgi:hypothetical protein
LFPADAKEDYMKRSLALIVLFTLSLPAGMLGAQEAVQGDTGIPANPLLYIEAGTDSL